MNKQFLTDKSRGALENQGWVFREPTNTLLDITPPNTFQDLHAMPSNWEGLSGFNIINIGKLRKIDNNLHDRLLEQSLQENEDIWRRLAQK